MRLIPASIGIAAAIAFATPAAAQITPAFEFTSANVVSDGRPYTLGFAFDLTAPTTINGLGYWADGLQGTTHQVGIWNSSGTLLAVGNVSNADALVGHYRYDSITPLLLGTGSYVIGGQFFSNGTFPVQLAGVSRDPAMSYIADRQIQGGFAFPTQSYGTYGPQGIALVNYSIAQTSAVPEPASWAMMLVGFGGIGMSLRRRKRACLSQAA